MYGLLSSNLLSQNAISGEPIYSPYLYLYNEGDECTALTGGWSAYAARYGTESFTPTAPTLTKNAGNMAYSLSPTNKCGVVRTANLIDLTNYTELHILHKGTLGQYSANSSIALVAGTISGTSFTQDAATFMVYTGAVTDYTDVSLDISALNSSYTIFIRVQTGAYSLSGDCTKIWLEA